MGLLTIRFSPSFVAGLAYRGWRALILAPAVALLSARLSGEALLAWGTSTFMVGAGGFVIRWLGCFLLVGIFGKRGDDSGAITSMARDLTACVGRGLRGPLAKAGSLR